MSDTRQWWAQHDYLKAGPCGSREEAAQHLFAVAPRLKDCMTGYGTYGPHFDIQWIVREEQSK